MKQQTPERTKRLAVIAAAAVILVMVLLIIETFRRGYGLHFPAGTNRL